MKKIFSVLIIAALLINAVVICASAATADDVIKEISKNPVYHYVEADVKNLARSYEFTAEQYDQLLELAKEANTVITEDKGFASEGYPAEIRTKVMDMAKKACNITGFTYSFEHVGTPTHSGDIILKIFDNRGKLAFQYDGDVIRPTSSPVAAGTADTTVNALLIAAGVLAAAGLAAVCVAGRKSSKAA